MKQKRSFFGRVFLSVLFGALLLCLASCSDDWTWTKSTWTLENHSRVAVNVTPKDGADCDAFTLYSGQSKNVTWKNHSENYYSFSYSPSNLVYTTKYDSLREICFWNK